MATVEEEARIVRSMRILEPVVIVPGIYLSAMTPHDDADPLYAAWIEDALRVDEDESIPLDDPDDIPYPDD